MFIKAAAETTTVTTSPTKKRNSVYKKHVAESPNCDDIGSHVIVRITSAASCAKCARSALIEETAVSGHFNADENTAAR